VAKYFAIIPALFIAPIPSSSRSTSCGCTAPRVPCSRRSSSTPGHRGPHPAGPPRVKFRPAGSAAILRRNVWIYGVGGSSSLSFHQAHRSHPRRASRLLMESADAHPTTPSPYHGRSLPPVFRLRLRVCRDGVAQSSSSTRPMGRSPRTAPHSSPELVTDKVPRSPPRELCLPGPARRPRPYAGSLSPRRQWRGQPARGNNIPGKPGVRTPGSPGPATSGHGPAP